jgi:hypothetical protein
MDRIQRFIMRSSSFLFAATIAVAGCSSNAPTNLPPQPDASAGEQGEVALEAEAGAELDAAGAALDAPASEASPGLPACAWPTPVDAGPGACRVGRVFLTCDFPSGGSCDTGLAFGPNMAMLCISDDPGACTGCSATTGTATCTSKCAPNQYAMECGGPPRLDPDGGMDRGYYEQAPAECVLVGPTPSGAAFWCCPCQ